MNREPCELINVNGYLNQLINVRAVNDGITSFTVLANELEKLLTVN